MEINNTKRAAVEVTIEKVSKRFGSKEVLKEVSLRVKAGEIFVIMGPSGSGKTVLLKNIIGLEKPTHGRTLINESDASDPKTHAYYVTSIVFQSGALFNSLTVFDNLALYPREHRLFQDKNHLKDKVMSILKNLSLESAADKYPAELSGGMKKRVAIARALMMEPQLLLYDEPTSELDPITSANIIEVIGTLNEEFHVTSIIVSHDRNLAFSIGNTLALLMDGSVKAVGTPKDLKTTNDEGVNSFLHPRIDINNPRFRTQRN